MNKRKLLPLIAVIAILSIATAAVLSQGQWFIMNLVPYEPPTLDEYEFEETITLGTQPPDYDYLDFFHTLSGPFLVGLEHDTNTTIVQSRPDEDPLYNFWVIDLTYEVRLNETDEIIQTNTLTGLGQGTHEDLGTWTPTSAADTYTIVLYADSFTWANVQKYHLDKTELIQNETNSYAPTKIAVKGLVFDSTQDAVTKLTGTTCRIQFYFELTDPGEVTRLGYEVNLIPHGGGDRVNIVPLTECSIPVGSTVWTDNTPTIDRWGAYDLEIVVYHEA